MGSPTQAQVSELYQSGVEAVSSIAATFDDEMWSANACGIWTAAETVRHLVCVVDWYGE